MSETIGKYRVLDLLGQGAMGRVFRAEDPHIGRQVAVKVMNLSAGADLERFQREARIVGSLSHPNIVVVHDFGFHRDQPFLVMELLDGCDLQTWMKTERGFGEQLQIISDLCAAVSYAHRRSVLHRDIKPANIQILPSGHCKLMDFGIARGEVSDLTASGSVMGTPIYMAPEILRNEQPSVGTDIYAVGMICYEMLTGSNPFVGNSLAACLNLVLTMTPTHLTECRPDIPRSLADAVMRCIDKDPSRRVSSLQTLDRVASSVRGTDRTEAVPGTSDALEAGATAILTAGRPPSRHRSGRTPRWGLGALILAAVTAGAFGVSRFFEAKPADTFGDRDRPSVAIATPVAVGTNPPETSAEIEQRPETPPGLSMPGPKLTESVPSQGGVAATPQQPSPTPRERPTNGPGIIVTPIPDDTPPPIPTAASTPTPFVPAPVPATPVPATPRPTSTTPTLTAVEPNTLRLGGAAHMRLTGTGFEDGMSVEFLRGRRSSSGFRLSRVAVISPTLAEVDVIIDDNIPLGRYSIVVIGPDGRRSRRLEVEVNL